MQAVDSVYRGLSRLVQWNKIVYCWRRRLVHLLAASNAQNCWRVHGKFASIELMDSSLPIMLSGYAM